MKTFKILASSMVLMAVVATMGSGCSMKHKGAMEEAPPANQQAAPGTQPQGPAGTTTTQPTGNKTMQGQQPGTQPPEKTRPIHRLND